MLSCATWVLTQVKVLFCLYQFSMMHHFQSFSKQKDQTLCLSNPGAGDQQDFRTIPIYPTPEEFHEDQRPFLRPNLTSQRYTSAHIYLDTHFRLLREDFVRPLRDGIQQLLNSQGNAGARDQLLRTKHFDDIRVYFDTQVLFPTCTTTGIAHTVKFNTEPLKVNIMMDTLGFYLMSVLNYLTY